MTRRDARSLYRTTFICFLISAVTPLAASAQILRVNASAAPGGDGNSWPTAYRDLQGALDRARTLGGVNEIWVAAGTYKPDRATANRAESFALVNAVALLGGFAGNESAATQRNPITNPTILSGDIGAPNIDTDNCYHVVSFTEFGATSSIDGFIIERGRADTAGSNNDTGGGLYFRAPTATLTVSACIFRSNYARQGGALFSRQGTITIKDCDFASNTADSDGGAVFAQDSATLRSCRFLNNNAPFGGAVWFCCGWARLEDCIAEGNFANNGGAIFSSGGTITLANCTLTDNAAAQGGGADLSGTTRIASTLFAGNFASTGGGLRASGTLSIASSIFSRNFVTVTGAGLYNEGSATIDFCTFHANNAVISTGGFYTASSALVNNSILWNNTDGSGTTETAQVRRAAGTLTVTNSCVQNWSGALVGSGNFSTDPLLQNAAGPDGILGSGDDAPAPAGNSPCIDRADNTLIPADTADADSDGDTLEPLPLDAMRTPRRLDDLESPDAGAGVAPIADVGAAEYRRIYPGDINQDGRVDIADLAIIVLSWDSGDPAGDANNDGNVDLADIALLILNWGAGIPPAP